MKKSNEKKRRLFLLLPLAWMLVIFYFSAMNGKQSSSISNPISGRMFSIVKMFLPFCNEKQNLFLAGFLEIMVRKTAHMVEYTILSFFWYIAFEKNKLFQGKWQCKKNQISKIYIAVFLFTVFYACFDEFHQLFVNERSGRIQDVFIDSVGILVFVVLYNKLRSKVKY